MPETYKFLKKFHKSKLCLLLVIEHRFAHFHWEAKHACEQGLLFVESPLHFLFCLGSTPELLLFEAKSFKMQEKISLRVEICEKKSDK